MPATRQPAFLIAALVLGAAPFAAAQPAAPSAPAQRVTTVPRIDGRLDDAAWAGAAAVSGFKQREPDEGQDASEPTTVRIVYDDANLYIGAELTDAEAAGIRASEMRRDNTLDSDDTFAVLLDTYLDNRNAFVFRVNPRATRFDALVRNEARFYYADWDEQWTAAAVLSDSGWSVEIAIPFKILRFRNAPSHTWGLNFERVIKRKNETAYWSGWSRNYVFQNVSQAGRLSGISGIKQAERLRLRPYVLAGGEKLDAVTAPAGARRITEVGIDDLKWQATSTLTADLAVNPDFAQTEVDAQQVNLTRLVLDQPAVVGLPAIQQRRPARGDTGAVQLHLPHHRQHLPRLQRHLVHGRRLRGARQPVAGREGHVLTASLTSHIA